MLQAQCLHKSQLTNLHHLLGGMLAVPWRGWVGWRARLTWPWRRAEGAEFLSISKHTQPAMRRVAAMHKQRCNGRAYGESRGRGAGLNLAMPSRACPFPLRLAWPRPTTHVTWLDWLFSPRAECNSSLTIRQMSKSESRRRPAAGHGVAGAGFWWRQCKKKSRLLILGVYLQYSYCAEV
jgi:hypothetical protein